MKADRAPCTVTCSLSEVKIICSSFKRDSLKWIIFKSVIRVISLVTLINV